MKKVIIFLMAIIVSAGVAFAQDNSIIKRCTDNVHVTVTNLGNLPQNGKITVKFINPDPAVSCTKQVNFTTSYSGKIWGNENNEVWSAVKITVILGNNEYMATYSSPHQYIPVVFQGSDFEPYSTWEVDAHNANPVSPM